MGALQFPPSGLVLSTASASKKGHDEPPTQIIRLDLAESRSKALLQSLKNSAKFTFRTGKKTVIRYGEQDLPLEICSDAFPSEVYALAGDSNKAYFAGKLSQTLEASAKTDEALANLENSLKSIKEERAMNETSIVGNKGKKDHRPSPLLGQGRKDLLPNVTKSTPASPYLSASYSPRHGPTSAPLPAGNATIGKEKIRFEAIKIPVIHLLAARPMSVGSIAEKIRAPREDCERVLAKFAKDSQAAPGKKELKEKTYRDLNVWKFPYQEQSDRKSAIDRAIHAFDRMRVEKKDVVWQMLLPEEERGKGRVLSRLNFDKPIASQKPTPKTEASDAESSTSPRDSKANKVIGKRKRTDDEAKPKSHVASPAFHKKRDISPSRQPHADSKFKSSEKIEDSDEEVEGVESPFAKPNEVKVGSRAGSPGRKPASPRPSSPSSKKQIHKSKLSNSSSANENNDTSSAKTALKPPAQDKSNKSPRPRHGSSPQKPSPLGSSPPATSTDFDSSSSTKGTSQSSAPSSPPSSIEMPISKQKQKYSPVIAETKRDVSRGRNPIKRPLDDRSGEPPAKKQLINGNTTKITNGADKSAERPKVERQMSESERSSASDQGAAKGIVMDEAKRFQRYYRRYKDLHEKIANTTERERDDKDMDDLWKMHKRLKEMKAEIWQNWDNVEKSARVSLV